MKKIIYTSLFAVLISSCEDSSEKSMEAKMPELNEHGETIRSEFSLK